MRIQVKTKHYVYIRPDKIQYDFNEDFYFNWVNNIIAIEGNHWQRPCNNLEECFKLIKGYFVGTNYQIYDFVEMIS